MTRTIRLMTWLAVASAAPVTLADSAEGAKEKAGSESQTVLPARADEPATAGEEAGGGRGELPGQEMERHARADSAAADKRAQEIEAIKQYNERKFLEEVWTRP